MSEPKLDKEERDILESFELGEWKSVKNLQHEIEKHQAYARKTLKMDKRINIKLSSKDLNDLKSMALEDGIPYQALISSVLHRYVTGRLVEAPRARASSDTGR